MHLLVNDKNIIRCMATNPANLHTGEEYDKMTRVEVPNSFGGITGDEYIVETKQVIKHPENYPQKSQAKKDEALIQERMTRNLRAEAIAELKAERKLSTTFK